MQTFHDTVAAFSETADGLLIHRQQVIPQDFLDSLHSEREWKRNHRLGDMHRVASVPAQVVDVWLRQGRDVWNASPREIVQWLDRDGLQAFVATSRNV